jgi:hypothetical protein
MGQVTGLPDPGGALLPVETGALPSPAFANQTLGMTEGERYSFVFDGTAQSLDHALTSSALDPWLRGAEHSRGNADAPAVLATDGATALRSSDHDGTVVFVMTDSDGDGIADDRDLCAATQAPEGVPTVRLGVNHFALVDGDSVFDTRPPAGGGPGVGFTLEDTGGCSCEQIIDRLGLGLGQRKHGCSVGTMQSWVSSVSSSGN